MPGTSPEILVVDDDTDMVDVLIMLLATAGYAARSAGNGREALDAVAVHMPDLVLLDLLMPVMDGWQCARELRARYGRRVRIVVVTAAEHARARAQGIDVDDVVAKPFEAPRLLELIARQLAGRPQASVPPP